MPVHQLLRHHGMILLRKSRNTEHRVPLTAAEGEEKASRALREAAEVIAESPSALQVGQAEKYGSMNMSCSLKMY